MTQPRSSPCRSGCASPRRNSPQVLGISRSRLNDYTGKRAPRRPTDAVIPTLETELLRGLARYAEVTAP